MVEYFKVKNFEKFQHYKDRTPPWIKLYNELLDDYAFSCLQDASKLHLILIWLLASRSENKLPFDPAWIGNKISATEKVNLDTLLKAGFIEKIQLNQTLQEKEEDCSNTLADCKQDACLEKEGETEGEKEKDMSDSLESNFNLFWENYPRKENRKKAFTAFKNLSNTNQQKAITDCKTRYLGIEKTFIPLPTTYIHGERFNDDPPPKAPVKTQDPASPPKWWSLPDREVLDWAKNLGISTIGKQNNQLHKELDQAWRQQHAHA